MIFVVNCAVAGFHVVQSVYCTEHGKYHMFCAVGNSNAEEQTCNVEAPLPQKHINHIKNGNYDNYSQQ